MAEHFALLVAESGGLINQARISAAPVAGRSNEFLIRQFIRRLAPAFPQAVKNALVEFLVQTWRASPQWIAAAVRIPATGGFRRERIRPGTRHRPSGALASLKRQLVGQSAGADNRDTATSDVSAKNAAQASPNALARRSEGSGGQSN
jgi:hypothetical protein